MPKRDTNVTHAAFHKHRIGIHRSQRGESEPTGELIPVVDALQLSQRERDRCEAIAKFTLLQESQY